MRGIETRRRKVDQRDVLRGDKFLGAISASLPSPPTHNPSSRSFSFLSHQPPCRVYLYRSVAAFTSLLHISETRDNNAFQDYICNHNCEHSFGDRLLTFGNPLPMIDSFRETVIIVTNLDSSSLNLMQNYST